jgi:hypothetical protein
VVVDVTPFLSSQSPGATASISGTAAIGEALLGGTVVPAVVVPLSNGHLLVASASDLAQTQEWVVSSEALGGVIAVRFAGENSDTFIMGDATGRVFAVRDGSHLSARMQWAFRTTLTDVPITQAPAAVEWNGKLHIAVVTDTGNGALTIARLGSASVNAALTWPQHQHDRDNSGCLSASP